MVKSCYSISLNGKVMLQHQFNSILSLLFEEIRISPKLEVCRANQYHIRNQRIELRRNRLFLGRKAGGFVKELRIAGGGL